MRRVEAGMVESGVGESGRRHGCVAARGVDGGGRTATSGQEQGWISGTGGVRGEAGFFRAAGRWGLQGKVLRLLLTVAVHLGVAPGLRPYCPHQPGLLLLLLHLQVLVLHDPQSSTLLHPHLGLDQLAHVQVVLEAGAHALIHPGRHAAPAGHPVGREHVQGSGGEGAEVKGHLMPRGGPRHYRHGAAGCADDVINHRRGEGGGSRAGGRQARSAGARGLAEGVGRGGRGVGGGGQVSHAVRLGSSLSLLDLGGMLKKPAEKGKVSEGGCVPAVRAPSRPVYRCAPQTNGHLH